MQDAPWGLLCDEKVEKTCPVMEPELGTQKVKMGVCHNH